MENLDDIITAVCKSFKTDRWNILNGKNIGSSFARYTLCHIISKYYPYLLNDLADVLCKTKDNIKDMADRCSKLKDDEEYLAKSLKKVCLRLKIQPTRKYARKKRVVSHTKQLFGFDYTEEEELCLKRAVEEAPAFWEKMSRIGRQPLEDGMVFSVRKTPSNRGWYNE